MPEEIVDFLGSNQPLEVNIRGARGVITGGKYVQTRTAVYTRQQEFESVATPPPAATPVTQVELEVHVTILWSPEKTADDLMNELLRAGIPLDMNMGVEGLR